MTSTASSHYQPSTMTFDDNLIGVIPGPRIYIYWLSFSQLEEMSEQKKRICKLFQLENAFLESFIKAKIQP